LRPVDVNDNDNSFNIKYELKDEVDGVEFNEEVEVKVIIGTKDNDRLTIQIRQQNGSWFYFKKIAVEIKKLFAYCKV